MSQVKERPILFSAPMVRAILEGRKTVTRRAVKASKAHADGITLIDYGKGWWPYNAFGDFSSDHEGMEYPVACPYGKPRDRLWVRETFIDLRGTGVEHRPNPDDPLQRYAYAADCRPGSHSDEARKDFGLKYKPSIHMPRAASRILLEITDVRVERLQDITEEQAVAEGLIWQGQENGKAFYSHAERKYPPGAHQQFGISGVDAVSAFRNLWNSVGGDWDANPWVWVVEFKRVTP